MAMAAVNGARVTGEVTVRTVRVRFGDEPYTDSRGWKFKLLEVEAEVDVWSKDNWEITIVAAHAQRILTTGKPGQTLWLVGSFYAPIYDAARLAIEDYLRQREEIE